LGYGTDELLDYFYRTESVYLKDDGMAKPLDENFILGMRAPTDISHPKSGKVLARKGRKLGLKLIQQLKESKITEISFPDESLVDRVVGRDVVDEKTGEVLIQCNETLNEEHLVTLRAHGIKSLDLLHMEGADVSPSFRNTLLMDKVEDTESAILEIYRKLRPSNPPTPEVATEFFKNLFFSPEQYDLSEVGRLKLNQQLGTTELPLSHRTLTKDDILMAVRRLIKIKDTQGAVDDIDNLGNRRVRAVGELLENQYRIGLVRMERAIKERMSLQEIETLMPHDLINAKPVSAVVKEFFGTSQLSQFMDQTNPLSEITHKRRLSALGPGGLTRERAGFEVRDVHPTHYGRICPIETPEGPNIGLIVSLSTYARVNKFGFIETPYREVEGGKVSSKVAYLSAMDEKQHFFAQANAPLDKKNKFVRGQVSCRREGEFVMAVPDEVEFMDVSPNQLVSVAASLIPFLENDDANRALMGSNMQRQAVPLLQVKAPLVGTGIERVVAKDSGVAVIVQRDGVVEDVDASRIVIRASRDDGEDQSLASAVDIYKVTKFQRSNQNTCFNQKPIVRPGQVVKKDQIIADGPATEMGELALGRNVTVAFMSWGGYNFEDSILVSERVVKEDIFTSIHIEEFELVARDTKLGKEEITRDIPNIGEEALRNLDESGIIRVGATIKTGDILVGKVTPKGETQLTPEEKLLRAIFGEKAGDVKDTSLRVPPGVDGIVIDAKVFSRKGVDKDERTKFIEDEEVARLLKDQRDEIKIIKKSALNKLERLLAGRKTAKPIKEGNKTVLKKSGVIDTDILAQLAPGQWMEIEVDDDPGATAQIRVIWENYHEQIELVQMVFEDKIARLKKGDELPPGVIKMVKVYLAVKRKLSVGDKMAGRHGNKGVVSRVLPEEDMPYFADGTPVDIVLNPLGVPSRMNVGQVLETHLGWAAKGLGEQLALLLEEYKSKESIKQKLKRLYSKREFDEYFANADESELKALIPHYREGFHVASPVFDGAEETEIRAFLKEGGLPELGQATLYDGRNGEPFDSEVTVGVMYMMKLHHLVDDKLHARSIGPYSLVTQQPLGGKAQFGGQRLGEMEVWAMEAYGAAYALQEFLTVKSDDVAGRTRMYEKIVKGENTLEAGLPESFNVLVKELQALGLDVRLMEDDDT
jgi:DNA-directed RNA polymerase subunit beta